MSLNLEIRIRLFGWIDRIIFWIAGGRRRTFLLLAAWAVFLALIQAGTIGLSVAGAVIGQPQAMLILLGAAAGAFVFYDAFRRKSAEGAEPNPVDQGSAVERLAGRLVVAAGLVFTVFVAGFAFHNPDVSWDGMTYHVPPVHFWTLEGRVGWIDTFPPYTLEGLKTSALRGGRQDVFMNGYPKAVELIAYVLVGAFRHDQFLNMANLLFYPLAILGIIGLARLLGASAWLAAAAGMLFPFIPVVVAQSVTTYVDAGFSAAVIGMLAMLARCCAAGWRRRLGAPEALGFACLAGLALAAKTTGVGFVGLALGCLGLVLIAGALLSSGARARRLARAVLALALIVMVIGLVAGYWYARNMAHTGNPLYPIQFKLLGITWFDGIASDTDIILVGDTSPKAVLRRLANAWLQGGANWPESIRKYDSLEGGMGFLWIYGGLPAILLYALCRIGRLVRRRHLTELAEPRQLAFWPLLVIGCMLLWIIPGNHTARYTIYLHGLGLPCLAALACGVIRGLGARRNVAAMGLRFTAGLLFLAGAASLMREGAIVYWFNQASYATMMGYQKRDGIPKSDWTPYDIAVCADGAWRAVPLMKEVMASNKPAAFGAFPRHLQGMYTPGILSHPIGERPIHFIDDAVLNDAAKFNEFVQRTGIKYLLLDGAQHPQPPPHVVALARAGENGGVYLVVALK